MKNTGSTAAIVAAALLCALPAAAQTANAGSRDGFIVGFGVGFGATYPCDSCPSFAGNFYVGAMASPNLAVMADFSVAGGDTDRPASDIGTSRGLGLATFALAVQFWPADRFWVRTGVGIGVPFDSDWDDWDDEWDHDVFDENHDRSWAGIVGAGYDITRKGRFVLDIQARGAFAADNQSVSLGLGFNW